MKISRKTASPYGLATVSLSSFWFMLSILPSCAYNFYTVFLFGVCLSDSAFPAFISVWLYISGSSTHIPSPFQPFCDLLCLSWHIHNIAIYPWIKLPTDHKHKIRMQAVNHFAESGRVCHPSRCRKTPVCRNCGNGSFRQAIKAEIIAFFSCPRCNRYDIDTMQRQPPRQCTAPVHLPDLQSQWHIAKHREVWRADVLEVSQHFKILFRLIPQLFKFTIVRKKVAQTFLWVFLFRRRCERNRL